MLNPGPITDAIVAALIRIPDLANAMRVVDGSGNEVVRISAFHYRLGQETYLLRAVYAMPAPSVLVAWEGTKGGNFNGQSVFKHVFGVYIRMADMVGTQDPIGYEELCSFVMNKPPQGSSVNIRYMGMDLYNSLDIMDNPSVEHLLDEDGFDRFKITLTIPELGDN